MIRRHTRSRWQRVVWAIVELIGALFFASVLFLGWALKTGRATEWVRDEMLKSLHDQCGINATFKGLTIDPFPPTIEMQALEMTHLDGRPLLSMEDAIATLQVLPLFAQRLELDRVFVLAPKASIEVEDGRILDLPKCVQPSAKKPTSAPIVLGIRELVIERARFDLRIDALFHAVLDEFEFGLEPRSGSGSNVRFSVDKAKVWVGARELPLHRLRFLGELEGLLTEPRVALLDSLELQLAQIHLSANGSIDLLGPVYDAHVTLRAPIGSIHEFIADFPAAAGDVALDVRVQGTAAAPHGVGKIQIRDGKIDQFELGDQTTIDFAADLKGADISKLEVRLADGAVTGKGRIDFDKANRFPIKLDTVATDLSLGRVLDDVGIKKAWVDLRGAGEGHFQGTILNPTEIKGRFDYRLRDFFVYNGPWDRPEIKGRKDPDPKYLLLNPPAEIDVRGKWTFSDKGIDFSEVDFGSGDSRGTADAFLSFAHTEGVSIHGNLPSFDFKDLGPIAQIKFGGRGSVVAGIKGSYDYITGSGVVDLDDVNVTGIPFGHAHAEVRWHDDVALDFSDIKAKLGETEYGGSLGVVVKGEVPFSIKGQIAKGRVEDVLVPFGVKREDWGMPSGQVSGTFELLGPITHLTGPIDLDVKDARVLDETFERGHVGGRLERGAIVADDALFEKHGAQIHATGRIDPYGGEVRARARTKDLTLQKIDLAKASQPNLDADLAVELALTGNLSTVTGTLTAAVTRVIAGPIELQDGRITGKVRGKNIALKGRLLGEALRVDGDIDLTKGLPYRAQLELKEYDVPRLVAALNGHLRYRGLALGRAKLFGSLIDWGQSSGEIQLEKGEFQTESVRLETASASAFVLRSGVLETKRVSLVGQSTKLAAEGRIGSKIIDLKVVGKVDLGIAEVLSPAIEHVGGTLTLDSAIGGTPSNMNLVGTGRISDGILQWRGFASRLSGFSANLSFSQSTVLIDKAEGRWAEGKVEMNGNLLLDNYRVKNVALQVALEDAYPRFSYEPVPELRGLLNGNLSMEGTPNHLLVRGDLDVTRGFINPKLTPEAIGHRRIVLQNVYDPSQEILDLDIAFHAKEPVRVKNQTVEAEMKGDLRLTGTNQRLGMLGSASFLSGGRATVLRDYEILSGTIEFQDRHRFYPRYDVWVQSEACGARIRVNLVGTLDKFDASYTSNPAMDEANIASCLVSGRRLQDSDLSGGSNQASKTLLELSGLNARVRKVIPVDDFEVFPEYSNITHNYEPRVLVAKDLLLFGGTARLEYSSSTAKSEDRRFALRYRMTPQLTLQGSWVTKGDGQIQPTGGDLGLDLKYRWEW